MSRRRRDEDIERMLDGGSDPSFDAFADALRTPDPIDPGTAAAHIASAASLARQTPGAPADHAPSALPWWRRVLVRGAGLGLTAKLLLGGAVALAATGGAAAGGILPGPIQGAVADTVSRVGIHIPNPRLTTTTTMVTTATTSSTSTSSTTSSTTATTVAPSTATSTTSSSTTSTTLAEDGDDELVVPGATPGSYRWDGTDCDAASLSVHYTVTAAGDLRLDSVIGDATDIDADDDRIRVEFDDIRVDIRVEADGVTVDVDRDCATASGGGTSTTTTTVADEPDDEVDHEEVVDEPDDD